MKASAALFLGLWLSGASAPAQLLLTEFVASNDTGLKDEEGVYEDWIEIHNPTAAAVDLAGWALTDNAADSKWRFPALSLPAGGYVVVFASDKNRTDPEGTLHTNFKLSAAGEYLALVSPDGTIATEFAPVYPTQLPDVSYGLVRDPAGAYTTAARYFSVPTPAAVNGTGTGDLGPLLTSPAHTPDRPASGEALVVTVRVAPALASVAQVTLNWVVMFPNAANPVKQLAMRDDGQDGDAVAGDGIYTGVIPGSVTVDETTTPTFGAGRLIRWYFSATDTDGRSSEWPLYPDPQNSPRYLGTVAQDAANAFNAQHPEGLPVWYWFASNLSAAGSDAGTRGAVYFKGRLYDNVFIRRRGGYTSTGSKKFDFNSGDHCFIDDVVGKVEEANLNLSDSDPTLVRPPMAFEVYRTAGAPASAAFPVLMRGANSPNSPTSSSATNTIAYFAEQVDERFLERWGLDPEGALYKFVQRSSGDPVFSSTTDGVEKKTRQQENRADLQAVVSALSQRSTSEQRAARQRFMFDQFNLANLCNYLACRALTQDTDDIRKNFYFYRDTRGSGEWHLFPWDKDWTFGITGDGGTYTTHPFLGDQVHAKDGGRQWSLLLEALFNDPKTQTMYLRRLRSVIDAQLQPASVPVAERYLEARADAWFALLRPYKSSQNVNSIKSFLNQRRTNLYTTYAVTATNPANRLIPLSQAADVVVTLGEVDPNPVSGHQNEEYVEIVNTNDVAVDLSGWTVSGGINHTFEPGTVILPADTSVTPPVPGKLYLARDAAAFRARAVGPTGGQGLHVQGGWQGALSARGETLTLKDPTGREVATLQTPATPTPAQVALRITKLMYAPPSGGEFAAGDYEYIELRNIGATPLDLSGVHFDRGVTFAFPPGTTLAAGARILLVKNEAAFLARYGAGLPVGGVYEGSLANEGERLRLRDGVGEEVLDFEYDATWEPTTLRQGAALVIKDDTASWETWGTASAWRASVTPHGSPGGPDGEISPPSVLQLVVTSPAPLTLTGNGTPNVEWGVQRSVDLMNWETMGVLTTNEGGVGSFSDPAAPLSGPVFYRAIKQP